MPRLVEILSAETKQALRRVGEEADLTRECHGDKNLADLLTEIRGAELPQIRPHTRRRGRSVSPRVMATRAANNMP